MAKSKKNTSRPARDRTVARAVASAPSVAPTQLGGKLGLIVERLANKAGATAGELAATTGWQRHTVLGALSRLRSRGFAMQLDTDGDRKAYRLDRTKV